MLSIFTDTYSPRASVSRSPKEQWLKTQLTSSVEKVKKYWVSNIHSVPNNHVLVQAIKHLGSYQSLAPELYNTAESRAPYLSKNLKLTTDYNRGSFIGHKLYGVQDNMIYSHSDYVRPYSAVDNWQSLNPLKCLWLDSDKIDLSIPSQSNIQDQQFSSVAVDLPMLALMYKGFKNSRFSGEDGAVYTEDQFVGTWVLPSILESQVDMTAISALIAYYEGTYERTSKVDINAYIPSYGYEFEEVAKYVLKRITDTRMPYVQILQSMPSIYRENALQSLILPEYSSTIQVDWAMMATRMQVINFLLDVGGSTGKRANQGFINQLKRYTREIRTGQVPYRDMTPAMGAFIENSLSRYSRL